jgi:hypothetical protein
MRVSIIIQPFLAGLSDLFPRQFPEKYVWFSGFVYSSNILNLL